MKYFPKNAFGPAGLAVVLSVAAWMLLGLSGHAMALPNTMPDPQDTDDTGHIFVDVSVKNAATGNSLDSPDDRIDIYSQNSSITLLIDDAGYCPGSAASNPDSPLNGPSTHYNFSRYDSAESNTLHPADGNNDYDSTGTDFTVTSEQTVDGGSGTPDYRKNHNGNCHDVTVKLTGLVESDVHPGYYAATMEANAVGDKVDVNAFKVIGPPGSIIGYTPKANAQKPDDSTKFALQNRIDTGSTSRFDLYFAPDCNVSTGTPAQLNWYDADYGDGVQPKSSTDFGWKLYDYGPKGAYYPKGKEEVAYNINSSGSKGYTQGGDYGSDIGGSSVSGSYSFKVKSNHRYLWQWVGVDDDNGIQFQLPFGSVNYYTDCANTVGSITASCNTISVYARDNNFPDKYEAVKAVYSGKDSDGNPQTYTTSAATANHQYSYSNNHHYQWTDLPNWIENNTANYNTTVKLEVQDDFTNQWSTPDGATDVIDQPCIYGSITHIDACNEVDIAAYYDGPSDKHKTPIRITFSDNDHTTNVDEGTGAENSDFKYVITDDLPAWVISPSRTQNVVMRVSAYPSNPLNTSVVALDNGTMGVCPTVPTNNCSTDLSPVAAVLPYDGSEPEANTGFTIPMHIRYVPGDASAAKANDTYKLSVSGPTSLPTKTATNLSLNGNTVNGTFDFSGVTTLAPGNYTYSFTETGGSPLTLPTGSDTGCKFRVSDKPYMQVYGGDTIAGADVPVYDATDDTIACLGANVYGGMDGWNQDVASSGSPTYAGAGTEFGAQARAVIMGFASAEHGSGVGNNLTFANITPTGDAYSLGDQGGKFNNSTSCDTDLVPYDSSDTKNATGQYGGNSHIENSKTLFFTGNVFVNGNVAYDQAGSWTDLSQIPSFKLVALGGNIVIGYGVNQLDGTYVALPRETVDADTGATTIQANTGFIHTCGTSATVYGSTIAGGNFYNDCNNQLVINGSFIAKGVYFERTCGSVHQAQDSDHVPSSYSGTAADCGTNNTGNHAAEVFSDGPETWLNNDTGGYQPWDGLTSLPPVL